MNIDIEDDTKKIATRKILASIFVSLGLLFDTIFMVVFLFNLRLYFGENDIIARIARSSVELSIELPVYFLMFEVVIFLLILFTGLFLAIGTFAVEESYLIENYEIFQGFGDGQKLLTDFVIVSSFYNITYFPALIDLRLPFFIFSVLIYLGLKIWIKYSFDKGVYITND